METQPPQGIDIKQVVDIVLRRKTIIISCLLAALTLGLAGYLTQPKTYQGIALLSYQQQSINPALMSPDEQKNILDIVSTLSNIVNSRTNLEKLIKNEDLYSDMRNKFPMEDVIINMRKKIGITPYKKGDTFTVTFDSTEALKVARVTNDLASGFIEANMKYREERATDTSIYTKNELEMAKEILDKKEAINRDYKLKHYNEMPGQLAINIARLDSLQNQYQSRQRSIQELERTRILIRDQIEIRKQVLSGLVSGNTTGNNRPVQIETDQAKLLRLRNSLVLLQDRYTDQHPKIKSLKRRIASLEKRNIAREKTSPNESEQNFDATLFELDNNIEGIGLSIQKMNKEKVEINNLIQQYEQWIEATPVREAEWSSLTREHGELKRHYDALVSQNLQAGSALNLERKQKGSQFKIVDMAKTPTKPINPDFMKFMGIALLAGAGLAGGLIAALEFHNTSYRDPEKLSQTFDIDVICSVPHISLKKEIVKDRIITKFGVLFFLSWAISLCTAIFYFWQKNFIIL